jgi:hypothetical protein
MTATCLTVRSPLRDYWWSRGSTPPAHARAFAVAGTIAMEDSVPGFLDLNNNNAWQAARDARVRCGG